MMEKRQYNKDNAILCKVDFRDSIGYSYRYTCRFSLKTLVFVGVLLWVFREILIK
jgi:hypothetical protein